MQVGSKAFPPQLPVRPRHSPIWPRAHALHNRKELTMTGVVFLVCVTALLVGSLIVSSDA